MKVTLRGLQAKDRPVIQEFLTHLQPFGTADHALALELIDIALKNPAQEEYLFIVAVNEQDQAIGYACYGLVPLTDGTYDLYWIAVDSACAGQGIGTILLKAVEEDLIAKKARMMVIETSSAPEYELTRRFYIKNNCPLAETIPDFYRDCEDKVVYIKRFSTRHA